MDIVRSHVGGGGGGNGGDAVTPKGREMLFLTDNLHSLTGH